MLIIGCDYHPGMQQIAWFDEQSGECGERRLEHSTGEAERFYRELKRRGVQVRVGIEASGHTRWFERLLAELEMELWIGNPAKIAAQRVRKQKTDREDARLLLQLLREGRFPRLWVPSPENRDLRQLLWHRHRLVQMRTRVKNQLQAIALNEGVRAAVAAVEQGGTSAVGIVRAGSVDGRRRHDLLGLLDQLTPQIAELSQAVEQEAERRPEVQRLMTHPGVGPDHGAGLRVGAGHAGSFPLRQAGGQLPGTDSLRRLQRRETTPGTPEQAGQHAVALLAGGSGASGGALRPGVAAALCASGHAAATQHRHRRHGAQAGGEFVLDVAQGRRNSTAPHFGSHVGQLDNDHWCVVEHRPSDWAPRSLPEREFAVIIMVEVAIG